MQITAAVARAKEAPLSLEEISIGEPRSDEVLVHLVATGICHTDISMRDHIIYPVPHPVVLGHEGAGIVERIGAGVTRLSPGDPVILTSASCGHCPSCDAGLPIYCYEFNERNFAGARIDGSSPLSKGNEVIHYYQGQSSFATHAVIRERSVVKAPRGAPLEMLAPLGCGIMTGAGAVINSLGVDIDNSIALFGTGSVGLSAIMAAKLVGAGTIIAVDLVEVSARRVRAWRHPCRQFTTPIGAGGNPWYLAVGSRLHRGYDGQCRRTARCRRAFGAARHTRHGRRRAQRPRISARRRTHFDRGPHRPRHHRG